MYKNKAGIIHLMPMLLVAGIVIVFFLGLNYEDSLQYLSNMFSKSDTENTPIVQLNNDKSNPECDQLVYENKTNINLKDPIKLNSNDKKHLLLTFGDVDYVKKITGEKEKISKVEYSPEKNLIVYLTGEEYAQNALRQVVIYDLSNNTKYVVYETRNEQVGRTDAVRNVKDILLSEDGNLLAITTFDSLFIYDIGENKLEPKFYKPFDEVKNNVPIVYSYRLKSFSEDKSKLLMSEGYYESSQAFLFNLDSNEERKLDFLKQRWDFVYGWYENNIVVSKRSNPESGDKEFLLYDDNFQKIKTLVDNSNGEISEFTQYVDTTLLYSKYERVNSDEYVCNSANTKYEVTSELFTFSSYDLDTERQLDYFKVDSTKSSGVTAPRSYIRSATKLNILGEEKTIVLLNFEGEDGYYIVFPDQFNTLQKLEL